MATGTSYRPWEDGHPAQSSTSTLERPQNQHSSPLPPVPAQPNRLPSLASLISDVPTNNGQFEPRDSVSWTQSSSIRSSGFSNYPPSSVTGSMRMSTLSSASEPYSKSHYQPHDTHMNNTEPNNNGSAQQNPGSQMYHNPNTSWYQEDETARRDSNASFVHNINNLRLSGPSAPYSTALNHSSTSIRETLASQRVPSGLRASQSSAGLHQVFSPTRQHPPTPMRNRQAPIITHNPRSNISNALEPIPGQPYAFPDLGEMQPGELPPKQRNPSTRNLLGPTEEEAHRPPPSREQQHHPQQRRASTSSSADSTLMKDEIDTESIAPSQTSGPDRSQRISANSRTGLPRRGSSLVGGDDGSTPYSRTPALRDSHKMAERKRRGEMKVLFDQMRDKLPPNVGAKASKWEILTKGNALIDSLGLAIRGLEMRVNSMEKQVGDLEMRNHTLLQERAQMVSELSHYRGQLEGRQAAGSEMHSHAHRPSVSSASYAPPEHPSTRPQLHSVPSYHSYSNSTHSHSHSQGQNGPTLNANGSSQIPPIPPIPSLPPFGHLPPLQQAQSQEVTMHGAAY